MGRFNDDDEDERFGGQDDIRSNLTAAFEAFDDGKLTAENALDFELPKEAPSKTAPADEESASSAPGENAAKDDSRGGQRDAQGRFAKGAGDAPAAEKPAEADTAPKPGEQPAPAAATATQQQAPGQAAAVEQQPPPQGLSAKASAVWNSAPPEAREYIRETEGVLAKLSGEMTPVFEEAKAHGVPWNQYLGNLVKGEKALRSDPMYALQWLAEKHGVDLEQLADMAAAKRLGVAPLAQQPAPTNDINRAVQPIADQVAQISSRLQQREQAEAQQRQDAETARRDAVKREIQTFAADAKAAPHWKDVEQEVYALLPAVKAGKPNAPVRELLADAYERAIWANPNVRVKLQTTQNRQAQDTARASRSRSLESVTGHRGAPAAKGGSNGTGVNLRDEIAANWAAYDSR